MSRPANADGVSARPPGGAAGPAADTGRGRRRRWRGASRSPLAVALVLQAVISAGDGLAMVALASRVYGSSHAAWAVAAVFLAISVPVTALAPVAGLLLDRLPPRPVLVAATMADALVALAFTWLPGVPATLVLAAGFGAGAAVLQPGLGAIVPKLTGPAGLTRANGYLQAATWGGFTVGPLLAGGLTALGGTGTALAAVAVLYGLGALCLAALRLTPPAAPAPGAGGTPPGPVPEPGILAQFGAGLRYLRSDADAGLLVAVVGVTVAFANLAVVAEVPFAQGVLRSGSTGYALLVAGWTAGMLAGTLAGGRLPRRGLAAATLTATVVVGLGVALAGTAATLWQAIAAYGLGGVANGLEVVATRSFLNHRVPELIAGRVFALYSGALFGAASLGMAIAGGLLASLDPRLVLGVSGLGGVAAGTAGWVVYARRHARHLQARDVAGGR